MSISNIGVYCTNVRRLTITLIGVPGTHLTWPTVTIRHRCAMSEVSHWSQCLNTDRDNTKHFED